MKNNFFNRVLVMVVIITLVLAIFHLTGTSNPYAFAIGYVVTVAIGLVLMKMYEVLEKQKKGSRSHGKR